MVNICGLERLGLWCLLEAVLGVVAILLAIIFLGVESKGFFCEGQSYPEDQEAQCKQVPVTHSCLSGHARAQERASGTGRDLV